MVQWKVKLGLSRFTRRHVRPLGVRLTRYSGSVDIRELDQKLAEAWSDYVAIYGNNGARKAWKKWRELDKLQASIRNVPPIKSNVAKNMALHERAKKLKQTG